MQNLSFSTITLNMAELGPNSPLPVVMAELDQPYRIGDGVPEELQAAARYGQVPNMFPYLMQDGYSRERTAHDLPAVVLENSKLRAVVLPTLGGRLWELFDKASGKQLLHTHGTLQFANIALRKAWFAGGLEWNIGTRGHSPTTCDPLHTAIVKTPEGHDVLRMWEFERLREVVFQVDMWLPEDSDVLLTAVRIRNPQDHEVPMYWWSNAAVPETAETRVIAPATEAFGSDYTTDIARVRPTEHQGADATWLVNSPHAADFFFDIQPGHRHWIAAVDHDGDGLAMLSTSLLRGKKLFVWGQGDGGKRWQEWLSPGAGPYAEIQAGLAQTQFEHLAMPAGAEWSWVEAYGNAKLDPATSHGRDWDAAVTHASARLEDLVPDAELEVALAEAARNYALPPDEMLVRGSAWGALESARRRHSGRGWLDESGTPFADDATPDAIEETGPWHSLLDGASFLGAETFVAGADWEELLAKDGGAEAQFHLATMKHARQDLGGAIAGYGTALIADGLSPRSRVLATRGHALALFASNKIDEGLAELAAASRLEPSNLPLLSEAMTLSIRHGNPAQALALASEAPGGMSDVGRVRFLTALALAGVGKGQEAAAMLRDGVEIPDIREGEDGIAELWQEVCPEEPVPAHYRFGMH
ncbi:DUF5107 domain-containing protein [Arthrobacter sp. FW306-2-2C-D06B]|uniref:DUF5107 domain-containing protein n=1 Tax=Arthrobacter sp. FW306-2-2C-D06B TaxID=2879618 RepID=UPI001F1A6B92|nr:DUF5107 domain-containing protein [Arthrobacter sp. FW306-2-2C-D06B]UKA59720.1 DUF5107 domain-containing protein [Arthrobacter sp. FW306-2-2C-D06B]